MSTEKRQRTMMKISPKINRAYHMHKIDFPDAKKEEFLCHLAEIGADQIEKDFQQRQNGENESKEEPKPRASKKK